MTRMKLRVATWLAAIAAMVAASMMVGVPSASAAAELSNPSGTFWVSCGGAAAKIQVDWKSTSEVTIRWYIKDTQADGKRPVLRIHAHNYQHDKSAYKFGSGNYYYILSGGNGAHASGAKYSWNPSNIGGINHLWVEVKDGTGDEGVDCREKKNFFNWTRLAYNNALQEQGDPYVYGAKGPNSFD